MASYMVLLLLALQSADLWWDINMWLVLRILQIIIPQDFCEMHDRTILVCELFRTLFGVGAYAESDSILHVRKGGVATQDYLTV